MSNRLLHGPRRRIIGQQAPLWPVALNTSSAQAGGLAAAWAPFAAPGGTRLRDLSGRGRDIALQGAAYRASDIGHVVAFDGTDDYAERSGTVTTDGDWTVSIWVKSTDTNCIVFCERASAGTVGWYIGDWNLVGDGGVTFGIWDGSDWVRAQSGETLSGELQLITAVRHGTGMELYIDGALKATATQSDPVSRDVIELGRYMAGNDAYFTGEIALISAWDYALSAGAVRALYDPQARWSLFAPRRLARVWPATAGGAPVTRTASLQAALQRQAGVLASLDTVLRAEAVVTALAGAALAQPSSRGAALDLAALAVREAQADLEAALEASLELGAGLDASLSAAGLSQRAAALDGAIRRLVTLGAALEAVLSGAGRETAGLDAWLALGLERSAGLDALAEVGRAGPAAALQAALRATPDRTAALDAAIGLVVAAAGGRTHEVPAEGRSEAVGAGQRIVSPKGE